MTPQEKYPKTVALLNRIEKDMDITIEQTNIGDLFDAIGADVADIITVEKNSLANAIESLLNT